VIEPLRKVENGTSVMRYGNTMNAMRCWLWCLLTTQVIVREALQAHAVPYVRVVSLRHLFVAACRKHMLLLIQ
jgi:hypothetical protein